MAGYPPPFPPSGQTPGPPYGPPSPQGPFDYRTQRRIWKDQQRAQRDMARFQRDAYRAQMRAQIHGLRRGSLVGPLLIVGLGAIFLLVQLGRLSADRLWAGYAHWWPFLLIGIGLLLLLEWGYDQTIGRSADVPYGRRTMGGFVGLLIVVMIAAGLASHVLHDGGQAFFEHKFNLNQDDLDQFLGDKHESDQTLVEALPAGGSIEVDNPRGDVTMTGTSDDGQLHVLVHKEVYSSSDSDAASKAQRLSPNVTTAGGLVQLRMPALDGARADLIVTVPAGTADTVIANHGDVHVSSIKAPVTITANHGDVEVSAITGAINAHINNGGSSFAAHSTTGPVTLQGHGGDITLSEIVGEVLIEGDFFGETHVEHVRGGLHFHTSRTDLQMARLDGDLDISSDSNLTADQMLGPVVLTTRNRNITLERVAGNVFVSNRNGSVDLTSAAENSTGAPRIGNVTIENRDGSIELTLPERAGFHLTADTDDGKIDNDFSLPTADDEDKHNLITGTVGDGSATVKISTSQADISIKKGDVQPLAPVAAPLITTEPTGAKVPAHPSPKPATPSPAT